jgi:hypothetical protein
LGGNFSRSFGAIRMSVCHIGSGSDVADYEKAVAEFFDIGSTTMHAAGAGPVARAQMLGNAIARLVQNEPREGINLPGCNLILMTRNAENALARWKSSRGTLNRESTRRMAKVLNEFSK